MTQAIIDKTGINNLSTLAKLTPDQSLTTALQEGVTSTLEYAKILKSVNTDQVKVTNDITGLTNILRNDEVDNSRMFSQAEALSNARAQHEGYFVAEQALEQDLWRI